jgi:hypothetical protein
MICIAMFGRVYHAVQRGSMHLIRQGMDRRQPAETTASTLSAEALEREPSGTTGESAVRTDLCRGCTEGIMPTPPGERVEG